MRESPTWVEPPEGPVSLQDPVEPASVKTCITADGLRYVSKAVTHREFPGAPGSTISCLLCGRHVVRSGLSSFLVAGRRQYRCRGGCAG